MDLSPLIAKFFKLWYVIPVLFIIAFFKTPWFKGRFGEWIVNRSITKHFDSDNYHLIKDVTLPTQNGTTQIDHILVSPFGIFVIETKNMKGWIFGNSKQKTWTQTVYRHKNKFQNPIHQNYKHLKVLQSLLGLKHEQLHSLIIFIGKSTFKTPMPENVVKGGQYRKYIESKVEQVLSQEKVNEIVLTIESSRLERSFKTNREHVKHVKSIVSTENSKTESTKATRLEPSLGILNQTIQKERIPSEGWDPVAEEVICPKCNSNMILRTAKKGSNAGKQFWGCLQFPKCRDIITL